MPQKIEQILIFPMILLLLIQERVVHCMSFTAPCNCTIREEASIGTVECEWSNSSVIIAIDYAITEFNDYDYFETTKYDSQYINFDTTPKEIIIACQGTSYPCEDLPLFDKSFEAFPKQLHINSCSSDILRCFKYIYPNVSNIESIWFYDSKDISPLIFNSYPQVENITYIMGELRVQLYPYMFKGTRVKVILFDRVHMKSIPDDTFNGAALVRLGIVNSDIKRITSAAFRGLSLEYLYLVNNTMLKSIDPQCFSHIENLENLKLISNNIEYLSNELLRGLSNMKAVYIIDNMRKLTLDSQVFAHTSLNLVQVSNSKLDKLPIDLLLYSDNLWKVNFENNLIEHLPPKLFWHTVSVKDINLKRNKIQILPEYVFSQMYLLEQVDLRENNIIQLNRFIFGKFSTLNKLLLDNNRISVTSMSTFEDVQIKSLSLSSNKIKYFNTTGVTWSIFDLNLSDNDISKFSHILQQLPALKKLNLTRNNIDTVNESVVIANGVVIDLRNNNISDIIKDSDVDLKSVLKPFLYLSNNPFEHNCRVTTILKNWNIKGLLFDSETITFTDGDHLSKSKLYAVCNNGEIDITFVGSWTIGGLVMLIIVISIIRHRAGIWQKITNVCNRDKSGVRTDEIRLYQSNTYDIFISFAYQDGDFVTNDLLPKLENNFNQKVCVHYRDWTVGELIPDQIIKSVENSRLTIIILTEHFLDSEWSQLEFHTAHNLGKQERRSRLLIVIKDEDIIRNEKLNFELKSYLVINRYLLWKDFNFWKKMQQELPRQDKNPVDSETLCEVSKI